VAADLLLTGRHITADEAWSIGLIGHVVPDGQVFLDKRPPEFRDRLPV
jgi:enoyl-CoA hydratase